MKTMKDDGVLGPSGALDGATMATSDLDGSGFITNAMPIEDSGAYIQTYGGRAVFQIPRAGKYLVTAEWAVGNSAGALEPHSLISRWDSGGSAEDNRDCYALTGTGGDIGGWRFVHTTQIVCAATDYVVFKMDGAAEGLLWSTFSITYLYAPTLAPA